MATATVNRSRPDFVAEVRLLATAEGGRSAPARSGYRAAHDFGVKDGQTPILNDAEHIFEGAERLNLGESRRSEVRLLVPEYQFGRLYPGMRFTIQEGAKVVGHGTILEVLDPRMGRRTEIA